MSCGICIRPMSLRQVLDTCVLQSYSRAWRIGRAIVRARRTHDNIIQSVAQQQDGSLLLSGKVSKFAVPMFSVFHEIAKTK